MTPHPKADRIAAIAEAEEEVRLAHRARRLEERRLADIASATQQALDAERRCQIRLREADEALHQAMRRLDWALSK